MLDQELAKTNQVRIPIISDGHCIVRALTLESNYPLKSYIKLLHCACNEIEDNLSFYSEKIVSGTNVSRELDEYKKEKKYTKDIVDLVIYALANCTQSTVLIYYVCDSVVKRHEIPPARELEIPSNRRVTLARIGEHYEAVLMTDTFQRISENTVIIDSPVKEGNGCPEIVLSYSEGKASKRQRLSSHPSSSAVSSDDSLYSDSSSNNCLMKTCHQKKVAPSKLTPDVWADVSAIKCTSLPSDIDGTTVYELHLLTRVIE